MRYWIGWLTLRAAQIGAGLLLAKVWLHALAHAFGVPHAEGF